MRRTFSFLVMTIVLSTLLISCGGGGTSGGVGGTPPTAFELVNPANGATGVSLTPTFQWTDSTGESSYKLQIDTNDQFQNPMEIGPIPADTTSSTLPPGMTLPPGTTYYWRVVAVNTAGQTTASNAPFSFTTATSGGGGGGDTPPTAFELVNPANGATGVSLLPIFFWTDSTGESSYILHIDTDDQFQDPMEIGPIPADTTVYTLPSGLTLPPGTTYYWRVIAVNDAGQTTASNAPFSFTTKN